jgi:hypothetical protein
MLCVKNVKIHTDTDGISDILNKVKFNIFNTEYMLCPHTINTCILDMHI